MNKDLLAEFSIGSILGEYPDYIKHVNCLQDMMPTFVYVSCRKKNFFFKGIEAVGKWYSEARMFP